MYNDTQKDSISQKQGQDTKNPPKFSALDRTFPPVWIVAGVVIFICVAVVVMGWKVIGIETEQEQVERERLLLAEQRIQHQQMLESLPALRETHAELVKNIAMLSGERDALQLRIDKIDVDLREATDKRDIAVATRNTAMEEERQIGDSVAQMKSQLSDLTPKVRQLGQQEREMRSLLETLDKQRESINSDISKLKTQKQEYELTVQSLATQIDNRKEELATMTHEQGELINLARGFQEILDRLESAERRADGTFTSLEQGTKRLSQASSSVEERSEKLTKVTLGVEQQTDDLRSSIQQVSDGYNNLNTVVTELQSQPEELRSAVQNLETVSTSASVVVESIKLVSTEADTAVENMEAVSKSAITAVESLNESTENLENPETNLIKAITALQNQVGNLKQNVTQINKHISALNTATDDTQALMRSIESGGQHIKNVGEEMENISKSMKNQIETLQSNSSEFEATNRQLSTTTTNLAERTADLDSNILAVKEVSEKIDEIIKEAQDLQGALIDVNQTVQTSMQPIEAAGSIFSENVTSMQNDRQTLQDFLNAFQVHVQELAQAIKVLKKSTEVPSETIVTQ